MKKTQRKSASSVAKRTPSPKTPPAATPSQAQQLAAAILEVLAGLRSPAQAAEVLSISLPRYYQLEARALEGLVAALAPRPKGKQPALENRVRQLEQELEAARRACARQEALVRVTQRSLGLAALAKPPAKANAKTNANGKTDLKADASATGRRRKSRRPMVRALRAAQQLRTQADRAERPEPSDQTKDAGAGNSGSPAVQPIAPSGTGEESRP